MKHVLETCPGLSLIQAEITDLGVEDGRVDAAVSQRPEFILISTEVKGYRHDDHLPVQAAFDAIGKDTFVVDYVRVFDPVK